MKLSSKPLLKISALLITAGIVQHTHAAIDDLSGEFANEIERKSADALLATYDDLIANSGCAEFSSNGGDCTGKTLTLFNHMRQILHTANDITNGRGQTEDSTELSLIPDIVSRDPNGSNDEAFFIRELGKFLRWNSGEEYAAHGSMSRDFVQGQTSGLSARLSTLRMEANLLTNTTYNTYALTDQTTGGGAGDSDSFSRWSGFLNYTQGSGTKAPTGLEDAFDVDSSEITAGVDYRIDNNWVAGVVVGYSNQSLDFDSNKSIVDGGVDSDGYSLLPFILFQDDHFYMSFSGGYQALTFDTIRSIHYGYGILDADNSSSTDSTNTTFASELGYSFLAGGWTIEPYYKNNYVNTSIDAFTEKDLSDEALNLAVDEQKFSSMTHALGLKLQYVFSTGFGVIVPFASYQANNERHTGNTAIAARFANASSSDATFAMSTDKSDENYTVASLGVSSVIRGSRQTTADSAASGGVQVFVSYRTLRNLDNYDFDSYALGVRYEF